MSSQPMIKIEPPDWLPEFAKPFCVSKRTFAMDDEEFWCHGETVKLQFPLFSVMVSRLKETLPTGRPKPPQLVFRCDAGGMRYEQRFEIPPYITPELYPSWSTDIFRTSLYGLVDMTCGIRRGG